MTELNISKLPGTRLATTNRIVLVRIGKNYWIYYLPFQPKMADRHRLCATTLRDALDEFDCRDDHIRAITAYRKAETLPEHPPRR